MKRALILLLLSLLPATATAFDFVAGWNLAGNAKDKLIDVAATFGSAGARASVNTLWKWDPVRANWAFYTPTLADGGAAYAATKGYQALKMILPGEGFWLNAASTVSIADPVAPAVSLKPWQVLSGWNLVATGAGLSAAQVNSAIAPFSARTIWAWDSANASWYFHTPDLSSVDLANYIAQKQYRDFGNVTLAHGRGFWINRSGSGASPTAALAPLDQARQMVAELRTTGNSWANASNTGALNAQIESMKQLGSGIVGPSTDQMSYRLAALYAGETLYRQAKAGKVSAYTATVNATTGTTTYSTWRNDVWQPSSTPTPFAAFYKCSTNGIGAAQPLNAVTCLVYDSDGYSNGFNWTDGTSSANYIPGKSYIAYVQAQRYTSIVFSEGSTAGSYPYKAELKQTVTTYPVTGSSSSATSVLASGYAGSMQASFDANGVGQSLTLAGDLPSALAGSAKMTVNVSAARTIVVGGTCASVGLVAYCPTNYAISGTIAGVDAQGATTYSASLDAGSNVTVIESALGEAIPSGATPTFALLSITVQAAKVQFTGKFTAQNFAFNADGENWGPANVQLVGKFSDSSAGGAGTIFDGSLDIAINSYATYHSKLPKSSTNYAHVVTTINGTLALPSRPLLGLTLTVTNTGPTSGTVSGLYTNGDGVTLTMDGTVDASTKPATGQITLANQDGIVLTLPGTGDPSLKKAGTLLATVSNGVVYYSDGYFESLQ